MLRVNQQRLIEEFNLRPTGGKGFYSGQQLVCPACGKSDKFAIRFDEHKGGGYNCFRGSCRARGSIYRLLKEIGRLDLMEGEESISLSQEIPDLYEEVEGDLALPIKQPPRGFKRVYYDDYLDKRGFTPRQYNVFNVGVSTDIKLRNYIVFIIKDKENNPIAWIARSKYSKEWHDKNLKAFKEGISMLKLRYENSSNTDFGKILLGGNEITNQTHTVLIVEGLMDKAGVDRNLALHTQEEVKCCATWGNKVTDDQIKILRSYPNIKKIIILYDFGTVDASKQYGMTLAKYFKVLVGEFKDKNIDPGNADLNYLEQILFNLKDIFYFYKKKLM